LLYDQEGAAISGRLRRCSSSEYHSGYTFVVAPWSRLRFGGSNVSPHYLDILRKLRSMIRSYLYHPDDRLESHLPVERFHFRDIYDHLLGRPEPDE